MNYYEYVFTDISNEKKEILIALLSINGFDGFEESDADLKAFTALEIGDDELHNIIKLTGVSYSKSEIKEINWNAEWESSFEPVTVPYPDSDKIFANIRAHFHPAVSSATHEVIITPKMSFGTGHHATTFGMIESMISIDFKDKEVIDFGTGTGVLAILAEKMGARHINAIDNDEWSISNAAENIKVNRCSHIDLIRAESLEGILKADIILANINLNVIVSNLDVLVKACKKDTVILFSGMLSADKTFISAELYKHSINISNIYERNNWIVILCDMKY